MSFPPPFPERPTKIETKDFSFSESVDDHQREQDSPDEKLVATELFSLFTADIIKEKVVFTR